jgi:hypothetical protein
LTYYFTYFTLLVAVIFGRKSGSLRKLLYWSALIALFLFVGLRLDVGCDFSQYKYHFSIGGQRSYEEIWAGNDPGHWLIVKLLSNWGFSYQSVNIVASGLFFMGVHVMARRQLDPLAFIVLCFPILIINMPMAATRQSIAIGFMCFAYVALLDRRVIFYVGWILLGSTFHSSILVFLLFAPFVRGDFNRRNVVFSLLLAVPGVFGLLQTHAAATAESRYIDTGIDAAGSAFRLGILSMSGLFFMWKLAPSWREQFPLDYKLVAIGSWMMIGFFALFFISSVIGDRFGYYLIPIQAMIFARIPYLTLGDRTKLYAFAPYAALTLVFVVWTQTSWHFNKCYVPYQFGFG